MITLETLFRMGSFRDLLLNFNVESKKLPETGKIVKAMNLVFKAEEITEDLIEVFIILIENSEWEQIDFDSLENTMHNKLDSWKMTQVTNKHSTSRCFQHSPTSSTSFMMTKPARSCVLLTSLCITTLSLDPSDTLLMTFHLWRIVVKLHKH